MKEQLQQLRKYANEFIAKHPEHKQQVNEFVQLCKEGEIKLKSKVVKFHPDVVAHLKSLL